MREAVGAIVLVLALGLALRLIIAYLLPGSGFKVDLGAFRFWAGYLAAHGPWGFYDQDFLHDYLPGYMYVLWLVGAVGSLVGGIGDLIKIPPILADLVIGYLVYSMVQELGARRNMALGAALLAVLNPISWFDSVVWGQADAFGVVFMLLGLRELWRDRPERAAIFTVIAAIIKPQLGILVPLVAVVTIRRALWPTGGGGDPESTGTDRPIRILTTGLAGVATAVALSIPFGLSPIGFIRQLFSTTGTYPYTTVNAYNPWSLIPSDIGGSPAATGGWICDAAASFAKDDCGWGSAMIGPFPAIVVGTALLIMGFALALVVAARWPDRLTLLVTLAVLALAFFMLPTRVHERYGYPFFPLAAILAAVSIRWLGAYLALSVATFLNMYVVLTTIYTDNPGISDWLGIGPLIRNEAGIAVLVLVNTIGFGWVFLQLRPSARARLATELEDASVERAVTEEEHEWPAEPVEPVESPRGLARVAPGPASAVSAASMAPPRAVMPSWTRPASITEVGLVAWLRERWADPPIRPDRSAALAGERGGRLDRIDLWFLIVLVLASMTLRTFRLAEPYQMHFDEVYHARTATEFLQDWRYGEAHDIYEWTHPHLAKYLMAAGLVLWGEDDVAATSDLGVPVRAAAIEQRREDADGQRAGERLFIATGDEVRTYDLRTRALLTTIAAAGAGAVTVDQSGLRLVVGFDDGRIGALDLDAIGRDGSASTGAPLELANIGGPVDRLYVTDDGNTIAAASGDHLTFLDALDGTVSGRLDLRGLADLGPGGSGDALEATLSEVTDPAGEAATLAELLDEDAPALEAKLRSGVERVILGGPGSGDARTKVEAAISDDRLPGIAIRPVSRVAVATADGVSFVDPESGTVTGTVPLTGGAHGLAEVTGVDDPRLYISSGTVEGPTYDIVAIGGDDAKDGPTRVGGTNPLPGLGSRVVYDPASQMVHVLGLAPGSAANGPWTVYVIEPHANAVYADARLPDGFVPADWAADVNADYPASDRQDLLVFDERGATASIELGSHAFAWRLPGVIAGALTLVCLYLLARILFRRRLVAGLAGLFVLIDGMFFVQSRIGMNDVYVGLFMVAAYTLFAAVWTGWWRGRWAFWLAMPAIGLLLGLALASKWVALYAMVAMGLLILVRSALGRVLTIIGLILATAVLGYLAIWVPADVGGLGNATFFLIMVGLTLLAVVVSIFHPIAWTDEEMWLALLVPAGFGTVVFLGSVLTGRTMVPVGIGPLAVTPLLIAVGSALGSLVVWAAFTLGGRMGFGPLAAPPGPDDPGWVLERAAPPPVGWLRPGWLFGIPILWAAICLVALPIGVYIVSYIPWALIGDHRIIGDVTVFGLRLSSWPPDHSGQTLIELTRQMYGYHNGLTSPHPASSPWWAWPLDLKPVWFYQEGLAGGTSAAIYDAGNLVVWWLGAAAMAFVSLQAYRRRSLALALIAIAFAFQWLSWARIDRAAFQYHYYTSLPFIVLALAYFIAEIWNGPSRFTWRYARIAGAVAVTLPAALWLLSRPLCAIVGVESVNPGSAACPAVIPDFVLTTRTAALAVIAGVGLFYLVRTVLAIADADPDQPGGSGAGYRRLALVGGAVAIGFIVASRLGDDAILTLSAIPVEPIVLVAAIPLGYLAMGVFAGRDPRRFVVGYIGAAVAWAVILYPNIAAVPLPSMIVNAYQGLLPTYLYAFQFPVNTANRTAPTPLLTPTFLILGVALVVTVLVVAYSAWYRRLVLAEDAASTATGGSSETDALARSGGA